METKKEYEEERVERERNEALGQFRDWLETPMLVLGFLWLALLVIELTRGLTPFLSAAATAIWIIFILNFAIEFFLAPRKIAYLKGNWLVAVSLMIPALRVFRAVRVFRLMRIARVSRGVRLLKFITSLNRGVRALRQTMRRRGFGYVMVLTLIVTLAGAAGMYSFEKDVPSEYALTSYSSALWWTAMIMTTMGSQYWPVSPEGKVLCLFLAIYAFSVFGYVTAMLATLFIGLDTEDRKRKTPIPESVDQLRLEIAALRKELERQKRR